VKCTGEKKPPCGGFFSHLQKLLLGWLRSGQLQVLQKLRELQQAQQRRMREQRREQQQLAQQRQEQALLLFYRKQPRQQQRSQLPKREICSFLDTRLS
jgi:predicted alpha/beta superfamily hydrolase